MAEVTDVDENKIKVALHNSVNDPLWISKDNVDKIAALGSHSYKGEVFKSKMLNFRFPILMNPNDVRFAVFCPGDSSKMRKIDLKTHHFQDMKIQEKMEEEFEAFDECAGDFMKVQGDKLYSCMFRGATLWVAIFGLVHESWKEHSIEWRDTEPGPGVIPPRCIDLWHVDGKIIILVKSLVLNELSGLLRPQESIWRIQNGFRTAYEIVDVCMYGGQRILYQTMDEEILLFLDHATVNEENAVNKPNSQFPVFDLKEWTWRSEFVDQPKEEKIDILKDEPEAALIHENLLLLITNTMSKIYDFESKAWFSIEKGLPRGARIIRGEENYFYNLFECPQFVSYTRINLKDVLPQEFFSMKSARAEKKVWAYVWQHSKDVHFPIDILNVIKLYLLSFHC